MTVSASYEGSSYFMRVCCGYQEQISLAHGRNFFSLRHPEMFYLQRDTLEDDLWVEAQQVTGKKAFSETQSLSLLFVSDWYIPNHRMGNFSGLTGILETEVRPIFLQVHDQKKKH